MKLHRAWQDPIHLGFFEIRLCVYSSNIPVWRIGIWYLQCHGFLYRTWLDFHEVGRVVDFLNLAAYRSKEGLGSNKRQEQYEFKR